MTVEGGGGGGAGDGGAFVVDVVPVRIGKCGTLSSVLDRESLSSLTGVGRSKRMGVVTADDGAIGLWELRSSTNFSSSTMPGRSGSVSGTFI